MSPAGKAGLSLYLAAVQVLGALDRAAYADF
jgi:hypothetical protein